MLDTASAVGEERFSGDPRKGPMAYTCSVSDIDQDKERGTVEFVRHCSAGVAECGSVVSGDEVTLLTVSGDSLRSTESRRNEEREECAAD